MESALKAVFTHCFVQGGLFGSFFFLMREAVSIVAVQDKCWGFFGVFLKYVDLKAHEKEE